MAKQEALGLRGTPRAGWAVAAVLSASLACSSRFGTDIKAAWAGRARQQHSTACSQDGSTEPGGGLWGTGFVLGTSQGHQPRLRGEDHAGRLGLWWVQLLISLLADVLVAEAHSWAPTWREQDPGAGWEDAWPWVPNAPSPGASG